MFDKRVTPSGVIFLKSQIAFFPASHIITSVEFQRIRALVDSGTSVSLLKQSVHRILLSILKIFLLVSICRVSLLPH